MRVTKIHTFIAIGYLSFLGVAEIQCQQPGVARNPSDFSSLRDSIEGFCAEAEASEDFTLGTTTFRISNYRSTSVLSVTDCVASFSELVNTCITQGYSRGITTTNDVRYELLKASEPDVQARAPAEKLKVSAKKTAKKATPPKTSKAAAEKIPKATPVKPAPTKATSLRASSTRSSSAASASATGSSKCRSLGKNDKVGRNRFKRENGPRSPHTELLRRAPKKGQVCGVTLESDTFTSSGKQPGNIATYGWTIADSCTDYRWGGWDATGDYETEHIMEWQMVTSFFKTLEEKWTSKLWDHPDPKALDANGKRKQIGFCAYWKEHWISNVGQFSIGTSPAMTVQKHIAYEYPSDTRYRNEFVVLQSKINSPAKQSVRSQL